MFICHSLLYSSDDRSAPYHYGLYNNDIWIFTDFSKPALTNTSDTWVSMPMSGDFQVENDGHCDLPNYNATVHYKSWTGRAPRTHVYTPGHDKLKFSIPDMHVVANVTLSFGGVLHSGIKSPIMMKYADASKGQLGLLVYSSRSHISPRTTDYGAHAALRRVLRRRRLSGDYIVT
jgi:hypothetical protein